MNSKPTFEDMPMMILALQQKIDSLETKIDSLSKPSHEESIWFDVKGLHDYLPSNPSIQTIYGWCSTGVIPYHKQGDKGKQNLFLKSEIDEWILTRGRKADYMIEEEALAYVNSKRG